MIYQLTIGQKVIEYDLIKSTRKSISICITEQGTVVVRSPRRVSNNQIEEVLYKKSGWIETKLSNMQQAMQSRKKKSYCTGSLIHYCGNSYTLDVITIETKKQQSVQLLSISNQNHDETTNIMKLYTMDSSEEYVKNQLILWYKERAKVILTQRSELYSRQLGVTYQSIKITSPKKRWGSCTSQGNINYNYRIIMAPLPIIDYLIVHELAHRKEMNHSPNFYRIIESILPEYKERQEWLKTNSMKLEL